MKGNSKTELMGSSDYTRDPRKQEQKLTRGSCPDDSEDGDSMKKGDKVEEDVLFGAGGQLEEDNMFSSVLLGPNSMVLSTLLYKALCWLQHEIPLIIIAKNDKFNLHRDIYRNNKI